MIRRALQAGGLLTIVTVPAFAARYLGGDSASYLWGFLLGFGACILMGLTDEPR